jgi:hypothetical protein
MKTDDRLSAGKCFASVFAAFCCLGVSAAFTGLSARTAAAADAVEVKLGDPSLTGGVPGTGPITLPEIEQWLDDPANFVELKPILPLGLSQGAAQITGLDENPLTRAKIGLFRPHEDRHRHRRPGWRQKLTGGLQPDSVRQAVLGRSCRFA